MKSGAVTLAVCGVLAGVVHAQDPAPLPWHKGVSDADKARARALLDEAAALKAKLLLDEAIAKYEQALRHWEHPDLRYELATVLQRVGRPMDAYENLQKAFAWGPEALVAEDMARARQIEQTLLSEQLAVVAVTCDEPGAQVALDGKPLLTGPGTAERVVMPGEHLVTAQKPGYFQVVQSLAVIPGRRGAMTIAMSEDRLLSSRRWSPWVPWATLGASAAVSAIGGVLLWRSDADFDAADEQFVAECGADPSCMPSQRELHDRAVLEGRLGTGALIVGAAGAVAGAVLLYLNQPSIYRTERGPDPAFELVPLAPGGVAGATARVRF